MQSDFTHSILGRTGFEVHRLGLSASYRPGKKTIHYAYDHGLNLFFFFGLDTQMVSVMRDLCRIDRESIKLVTGAYNYIFAAQNVRKALENRLRKLNVDYIDLFMFLGIMKPKEYPQRVHEELMKLREEGKIKAIGISCHDRKFAGKLADEGDLDVLMIRYNAAHRGAEEDIYPYIKKNNTGIISYTATRWSYLIREHKNWPEDKPIPDAGMCYRFVLSNPHAHASLTAPRNLRQLQENIVALEKGPLDEDEMTFIKEYGDLVHHTKKWFM